MYQHISLCAQSTTYTFALYHSPLSPLPSLLPPLLLFFLSLFRSLAQSFSYPSLVRPLLGYWCLDYPVGSGIYYVHSERGTST